MAVKSVERRECQSVWTSESQDGGAPGSGGRRRYSCPTAIDCKRQIRGYIATARNVRHRTAPAAVRRRTSGDAVVRIGLNSGESARRRTISSRRRTARICASLGRGPRSGGPGRAARQPFGTATHPHLLVEDARTVGSSCSTAIGSRAGRAGQTPIRLCRPSARTRASGTSRGVWR